MGILKESFVTNLPGFVLYWLHIDLEVVDYTDKIFIVFNMREKVHMIRIYGQCKYCKIIQHLKFEH